MNAATTEATTTAPEVVEARAALDRISADWRSDALDDSVLRAAAVRALDRALATRAAMAEVSHEVASAAITKVTTGDMSGLDDLIDAQLRKDAANRLRGQLKVPAVDADALRVAFELADRALTASDATIALPAVAWDGEMERWRQHSAARLGAPADPPLPSDLDRAASKRAAALRGEVDEALAWHQNWRQWIASTGTDPLSLLASATGTLEQRQDLAKRVQDATKVIGQANSARKAAGLTWTPPAAG